MVIPMQKYRRKKAEISGALHLVMMELALPPIRNMSFRFGQKQVKQGKASG